MLCQLQDTAGTGGFTSNRFPTERTHFDTQGDQMIEIILPVIRLQASSKIMVIKCICNKKYTFGEKKYILIPGK